MSLEPLDADIRIVITVDEVDHATIEEFSAQIRDGLRHYREAPHRRPNRSDGSMVIDLTQVMFLGSAGVRALIDADQEAMRHGGRIVVDGAQGVVLRTLEITGLLDHLQVQEPDDEATA